MIERDPGVSEYETSIQNIQIQVSAFQPITNLDIKI